jgi:RimJ/RimL family protein N-acetyltransferase
MLDPDTISFRPLQREDLPLLYRWHIAPHVRQWWDPPASYEALVERFNRQQISQQPPYRSLVLHGGQPIAYIQTYPLSAQPEYYRDIQESKDAAGIDMFIGAPEYLHRGLGAPMLWQFLKEIVFTNETYISCLIGPDPQNTAAIRAYEKAGFRHLKTVFIPALNETQYLMRLPRAEALEITTPANPD